MLNRRKILERIYDSLYAQAEETLKSFNPCEHKVVNQNHTCLGKEDFSAPIGSYGDNTTVACCCIGCCFWKREKGCAAEKPLACKTWLCGTAALKYPDVKNKLSEIAKMSYPLIMYAERSDKEKSLNQSERYWKTKTTYIFKKQLKILGFGDFLK